MRGRSVEMRYAPDENAAKQRQREDSVRTSSIAKQSPKGAQGPMTIGLDLGDKTSRYCVLDESGEVQAEGSVATTKKAMAEKFGCVEHCRVAIEVGSHSPWVSRLLSSLGHEVIVANARQVKLISASSRKDDRMDAQILARLARVDPELLRPIRHRSEKAQADLLVIRVRAALVEARTSLVNAARGLAKGNGRASAELRCRQSECGADARAAGKAVGDLKPLLEEVESLTEQDPSSWTKKSSRSPGPSIRKPNSYGK